MTGEIAEFNAGDGFTLPNVVVWAVIGTGVTVTPGDLMCLSAIGYNVLITTMIAPTIPQRRAGMPCIVLDGGTTGTRVRVQVQGRVVAKVKSTTGAPIAFGQPLCFGAGSILDADTPAVNANHWCAFMVGDAVTAGSTATTTAVLRNVLLLGTTGMGLQATGT